jgi:hypothetical protein
MLLKVMVAVWRRWLQRSRGEGLQSAKGREAEWKSGQRGLSCREEFGNGFGIVGSETAAAAEEKDMNTVELQRILGYLNIGLAIAHDSGVSIGHFGSGDFLQLAQTVNVILLRSIEPKGAAGPGSATAALAAAPSAVAVVAN